MNIVCTINEKFINPLKVLLTSLKDTQNEDIDLYFISNSLHKDEIEGIKKYAAALNINAQHIPFPTKYKDKIYELKIDSLRENKNFTIEVFFRLFIPYLLPENIHKVLYLDSDIIVRKDLYDFYHLDLDVNTMAACEDILEHFPKESEGYQSLLVRKEVLGMNPEDTYINSGVLLIDVDKMKSDKAFTLDKIFENIKDVSTGYHDQDIINKVFCHKMLITPMKNYNAFAPNLPVDIVREASIVHYANSSAKPWLTSGSNLGEIWSFWKHYEKWAKIITNLIK